MVFEQVTNINVYRCLKVEALHIPFSGVLSNQINSVQSGLCFETRYHACGMKRIQERWNLRISKETKLGNSEAFVCSENVRTSRKRKLQSIGVFVALLPDEDNFPSNQINRNDEKHENEVPIKVLCKERRRRVNGRMYKVHWTPYGLTLLLEQGVLSSLFLLFSYPSPGFTFPLSHFYKRDKSVTVWHGTKSAGWSEI